MLQQWDVPGRRAANLQNNHQLETWRDGAFKAPVGSLFPGVRCVIGLMWFHRRTRSSRNFYASETLVFCEIRTPNHRQPVACAASKNRAWTDTGFCTATWTGWGEQRDMFPSEQDEGKTPSCGEAACLNEQGTRDRAGDLLLLLLTFHLAPERGRHRNVHRGFDHLRKRWCTCLFKWLVKQQMVEPECTLFILFGFFSRMTGTIIKQVFSSDAFGSFWSSFRWEHVFNSFI